jgi:hypothetical protein
MSKKSNNYFQHDIFLEGEEDSFFLKEAEVMSLLLKYRISLPEDIQDLTSVSLGLTLTLQGENCSLNRQAIGMLILPMLITLLPALREETFVRNLKLIKSHKT